MLQDERVTFHGGPNRVRADVSRKVAVDPGGSVPKTRHPMFSLQRLLSKDDVFLDLLESCAAEAQSSIKRLTPILRGQEKVEGLDAFISAERRERKLLKEIEERLVNTFITGLEREDIESLSRALYKLVKTTEKFADRYRLVSDLVQGVDFKEQAGHLEARATRFSAPRS